MWPYTCEQIIQHSFQDIGKTHKSKCGKISDFIDENQRNLCTKHFKKWYKKKYGEDYIS